MFNDVPRTGVSVIQSRDVLKGFKIGDIDKSQHSYSVLLFVFCFLL